MGIWICRKGVTGLISNINQESFVFTFIKGRSYGATVTTSINVIGIKDDNNIFCYAGREWIEKHFRRFT